MNRIAKTLIFINLILIATSAYAQFCPFSSDGECSAGRASCGSKDYLDVSEAEMALLGKETFHANIAMIEKGLRERGANLPEKGMITSEFRSALIAFQESVGLPSNGEINQATLDKLGVKF